MTKKSAVLILLTALILVHSLSAATVTAADPLVQATFSTNPTAVAPGNDGYIQLSLKNAGTATASRVKISSVSSDSSIVQSGTWTGELSPMGAGDTTTYLFKFHVSEKASSGLYVLTFYIDYGADSTTRTINPNAIINVQSPSALEFASIKPSSLRAGEKTNMTFTIANNGNSQIANIVFTWTSSGNVILPLGSDNRVIIPTISANSNYAVQSEVSVSPSVTPGIYPLSISIQYTDKSGTNQTISSTAGIEVVGETDFDVSVQDSTTTSTTMAITNIGANTAYSVIVSIPQQESFRVTGTSTSIVGNLNAGEYALASFQIAPVRTATNISASQEKNLAVEVSYTDMLGVRRTAKKEVDLGETGLGANTTVEGTTRTRTIQGSQLQILGSNGLLYIVIGVAGIAAVIVFLKFRKGIRRKKE